MLDKLVNSIKGIVFGLILFFAAFVLLYWSEGRVNVSDIAINSLPASVETDGQLVYVTDVVSAETPLGDGMFLKNGEYLAIRRDVEVFSWIEKSTSVSEDSADGATTTNKVFDYSQDWASNASNSTEFNVPEGHLNIAKTIEDYSAHVPQAKINDYSLNLDKLSLPALTELGLSDSNIVLNGKGVLEGGFVFVGKGSLGAPQVGDLRVKYSALANNFNGTVFGKLSGQNVEPFIEDETVLYRLFDGSKDEALLKMDVEHSTAGWFLRILGFLMMWFGLSALFAPLSTVLDVVPVVGAMSRAGVGLITFVVSFVLTVITVLVSMLLHNVWAIVISVVVVIGLLGYYLKKKKKPKVVKV